MDVIEEVSTRAADREGGQALVIRNEAEERDSAAGQAISNFRRKLDCAGDPVGCHGAHSVLVGLGFRVGRWVQVL